MDARDVAALLRTRGVSATVVPAEALEELVRTYSALATSHALAREAERVGKESRLIRWRGQRAELPHAARARPLLSPPSPSL